MGYIRVYPKRLSDSLCDRLMALFTEHPELVIEGETANGVHDIKKSQDLVMAQNIPELAGINHELMLQFDYVLEEYMADFPHIREVADFSWRQETPKIKRYEKGVGKYGIHVDTCRSIPTRELVAIAYLNDVDEGGETGFPDDDIKVQPSKGDVLVFPPFWTYPHESHRVLSNDKYMVSTFYHAR